MTAIEALLADRLPGQTICPSEAARHLVKGETDWRALMPLVHNATDYLLECGSIELSWKGVPMDKRKGPYRIGIAPR